MLFVRACDNVKAIGNGPLGVHPNRPPLTFFALQAIIPFRRIPLHD
jgi:hypothetical protein